MKNLNDRHFRDYAMTILIVLAVLVVIASIYIHAIQALLPIATLLLVLQIYLVTKDGNIRWLSGMLAFAFGMSTLSNICWYLVPALGFNDLVNWPYYYYVTGLFWIAGYMAIAYVLVQMVYSKQWYLERRIDLTITLVGIMVGILLAAYIFINLDWQSIINLNSESILKKHQIDILVLFVYLIFDTVIGLTAVKMALATRGELRYLALSIITFFGINAVADLLFEARWTLGLSKLITINLDRVELSFHLRDLIDVTYNVSLLIMTGLLFVFVLDPFARRTVDEMRGRLKDTQLFVDDLIAKSPDATCIFDRNGRLVLVNDPFLQIFELKRNNLDRSFNIFNHPGTKLFPDEPYAEILKVRDSGTVIVPKLKLRGISEGRQEDLYINLKMFPTYGSEGHISNYVMIIEDITARIEMETALRQSEEKFRVLAETSPAAICLFRDDRFLYVNPAVERISGYSREEFAQMKLCSLLAPEYRDLLKERMAARENGDAVPVSYELRFISKDKGPKWLNIAVGAVDINGSPAFMVSAFDVTERKQAEVALRESEEKFRVLAEMAPMAIGILQDDRFKYANPAMETITGYGREELRSIYFMDMVHDDSRKYVEKLYSDWLDRVIGEPSRSVITGVRKGMSQYWFDLSWKTIDYEGRRALLLTGVDVTERKRTEEALRESEEKFRVLAETSPAAIIIYQDDSIVYVNPAFEKTIGYKLEHILTMKPWDFFHPDYRALIEEKVLLRMQGIPLTEHYDAKILTGDGRELWLSNWTTTTTYMNRPAGLVIAIDITERVRLEKELLNAYQSLKEEYARRINFTNAAAHELRTPLTPIIGYTDILKAEVKDERHRGFLEIIERNALRQKTLVNRMLELASLDAGMAHVNRVELAVRPLILEIADNYRAINPHIRVEVPERLLIDTDPDILRHVLDNLVSNAVKYSDNDKEVEIRVQEAGDSYQFSVKDLGAGIPKDEWGKIFERFYIIGGDSDSRTSGRSGLGLALVKAYISLIGGNVWLESEPGKGSTFFFTVPGKPSSGGPGH
jgi:PAS domain S-box-containing protein